MTEPAKVADGEAISWRLKWRQTWPDREADYVADAPDFGHVGRIYHQEVGPQGSLWAWSLTAHSTEIKRSGFENHGTEDSPRAAARMVRTLGSRRWIRRLTDRSRRATLTPWRSRGVRGMTRDEAIEVRRLAYEDYQKSKRHAFQLNADYGRWLIASLLLVHGATVAFLAQNERLATEVLPSVFWWHVPGLLLAFLCGFLVWANWSFHAAIYEAVNPGMIYNDEHWPKFDDGTNRWITRTHWAGIITGVLSALCILGSAIQVYCLMASP